MLAAGHGGQILLSQATYVLVRGSLPAGTTLRDLGNHRLRDLREAEQIWQIVVADLSADFPPLKSLTTRPNNLPLQPTVFIGRREELARCVGMLRDPAVRMLTLTGPGGVGKTRLALQVAAELSEDFGGGVFFVDLSPISRPDLVLATIADVLDVRESGSASTESLVVESIGARSLLLVIDSFEHLAEAAPAVARLLDCPNLKILVTSRFSLRVRAQREVPVATLPVPSGKSSTLSAVAVAASVRFFVDRATAVSPDFALTAENAPVVAEICRRLDGLPLAIELAAARVRLFPPDALLSRLERRLPLLTGGAQDAPARQRTLRDTIDWSFDLLAPQQQALFAKLSVFAGGSSLPSIEAIAGNEPAGPPPDLVDTLDTLVQHHLVRQSAAAGEPRFSMLATIREFGSERLEASGESEAVSRQHAQIYLELAERAAPFLREGRDEIRWLRELELEHDNLNAALNWSLAHDAQTSARMAGELSRYWSARGHLTEGADWLRRAIAAAPPDEPRLLATLLQAASRFAWLQGDYARSMSLQERSLELWQTTDDLIQIAWARVALADAVAETGDLAHASDLYRKALQQFRLSNVEHGVSTVQINLGARAQDRGEWEQAATLYEEALAIDRRLGDKAGVLVALGNLGDIALERGDVDEAKARFRESLGLAWELEDDILALQGLVGLGRVAVQMGDAGRGARLLAAAEAHSASIGVPLQPGERAGFDSAAGAAMAALGEAKGAQLWQEGREAELRAVVLAELASDQGSSLLGS